MLIRSPLLFAAAALLAQAASAPACAHDQPLSGEPAQAEAYPPSLNPASAGPSFEGRSDGWGAPGWSARGWRGGEHGRSWSERREHGRKDECWAQVKSPAQYAPPPTGPEYVWRRQPGPPGSPGPIWCLTVQPFPDRPTMISPERYGWVRVLCNEETTAPRIADLQRRLHAHGMYRGEIHGRYDEETAQAVRRFQSERHIEHHGYLSYETMEAIDVLPPPPPIYVRRLTTFDTGYIDWPGKVRY